MPDPPLRPVPGHFQQEFDRFALACFSDINEAQYFDLRRTFMAGASAFMFVSLTLISSAEDPTEADLANATMLKNELVEFNEAVKRGEK